MLGCYVEISKLNLDYWLWWDLNCRWYGYGIIWDGNGSYDVNWDDNVRSYGFIYDEDMVYGSRVLGCVLFCVGFFF